MATLIHNDIEKEVDSVTRCISFKASNTIDISNTVYITVIQMSNQIYDTVCRHFMTNRWKYN
jgi:hypothetical protein